MQSNRWGWALCATLGLLVLSFGTARSQDEEEEDGEESEIEVESGPDEGESEEGGDDAPRRIAGGAIPARAKDAEVKWRELTDGKKHYRLSVPTDWRIGETKADKDLVEFRAWIPGAAQSCKIIIRERYDTPTPNNLMQRIVVDTRKKVPEGRIEAYAKPFPMMRITLDDATSLWCFLSLRGHSVEIGIDSAPADRAAVQSDFLAAVARLRSTRPPHPQIPSNYKLIKKGRFRIAVHPGASVSLKPLLRAIADQDKKFVKFHGKPPKTEMSPVVFVHAAHRAGAGIYGELSTAKNWTVYHHSGRYVFTLPLPAKSRFELTKFSNGFACFNFIERYGVEDPRWALAGEADLASVRETLGLKLPTVPAALVHWHDSTRLGSIADLTEEYRQRDTDEFRHEAFFYVLFFHCGPAKYRKAYKAFLEDLRNEVDPLDARRRHLDSLDLRKIQAAAIRFKASKIKYKEPKTK